MARFDELGEREDRVRLLLDGDEVKVYGSYQVTSSVFQQPAAFTMQLGWSPIIRDLRFKYPPGTPFELRIGDRTIQSGDTDSADATSGDGGTQLQIDGRDATARLYDAFVASERSFANKSYLELLLDVLKLVAMDDWIVISGNAAHRKAISGGKIIETKPSSTESMFNVVTSEQYEVTTSATKKVVQSTIKAQLGTRWLDFLNAEFKKAGLCLWSGQAKSLVLARPTADQSPLTRIIHRRGSTRDVSNVRRAHLRDNIAQRYTSAVVYGRAGGQKFGRKKVRAEFVDEEIVGRIGGDAMSKAIVYHEPEVDSLKTAEFMARRHIAEANRAGWQLEYTLSGHTAPGMHGEKRVVWAPDTMVEVDDAEFGLTGTYYCHEVTFERHPHTTTTIKLMRPQDLVFAEDVKKAI